MKASMNSCWPLVPKDYQKNLFNKFSCFLSAQYSFSEWHKTDHNPEWFQNNTHLDGGDGIDALYLRDYTKQQYENDFDIKFSESRFILRAKIVLKEKK